MTFPTLQLKMHPTAAFRLLHHGRQFIRAAQKRRTYRLKPLRIDANTILVVRDADRLALHELSLLLRDVNRQGGRLVLLSPSPTVHRGNSMLLPEALRTVEVRIPGLTPGQRDRSASLQQGPRYFSNPPTPPRYGFPPSEQQHEI